MLRSILHIKLSLELKNGYSVNFKKIQKPRIKSGQSKLSKVERVAYYYFYTIKVADLPHIAHRALGLLAQW